MFCFCVWLSIIGARDKGLFSLENGSNMCFCNSGVEAPKIDCASPFGVEFLNKIPNSAMTSSSQYNQYWGPDRGRIRNQNQGSYGNCWLSQYNDEEQWIQVDLTMVSKITRIATQGRQDAAHWVKSYTLSYSVDCGFFEPYENNKVYLDLLRRKYNLMFQMLYSSLHLMKTKTSD